MDRIEKLANEIVCKNDDGGYLFTSNGIENYTGEERSKAIKLYEIKENTPTTSVDQRVLALINTIEDLYEDETLSHEELLSDIASEIACFKMKNV